jgi:hypothetical protein
MKKMTSDEYWGKIRLTKPSSVIVFFISILIGWIFYEFTDFLAIRWFSAEVASLWVKIFGHPESTVDVLNDVVYLYPLGLSTPLWTYFSEGCTPAAGIFPLFCLFAVPHSSWKLRLRNYLIYLIGLFLTTELVNAVEVTIYTTGVPWSIAHNQQMNAFITYGIVAIALIGVFTLWPESSMPFVFIPYAFTLWRNKKRANKVGSSKEAPQAGVFPDAKP